MRFYHWKDVLTAECGVINSDAIEPSQRRSIYGV